MNRTITNKQLLKKYLSPYMEEYFYKKIPDEDKEVIKFKISELLKFLILCEHGRGDIPVSREIDEIWHLWILQTPQYYELSEALPHGRYIHHSSNDYDDGVKSNYSEEELVNMQISYLVSYVINFGNFTLTTIKFWPMSQNLMTAMNFTVDELNQYLLKLNS